ncbi:hypothetical protein hbim_06961 [Mycolicibacterium mageritense]|uniref:Uncharacterized protein n=1 Tax=Mycolicibacterium mageritense TaxID=53462 RepID=A0AAI8U1X1_MYCME|nr:hypothetical protein hbim_06961 [Mycolicibacterium mageritense]
MRTILAIAAAVVFIPLGFALYWATSDITPHPGPGMLENMPGLGGVLGRLPCEQYGNPDGPPCSAPSP